MVIKFSKVCGLLALGMSLVLGFDSKAEALQNSTSYQSNDIFSTTSQVNIRKTPCDKVGLKDKVVGLVNKNIKGYYKGTQVKVNGTCRGLVNETWYKVGFSSPIPDGGTEYVEGYIAGKFLDHIAPLKSNINSANFNRVNISSGILNVRNGSLSGPVIAKLNPDQYIRILEIKPSINISGVLRVPTKVQFQNFEGKLITGWVDGNYLVAYDPID
ncbi:MAG: hypothetical protein ACRCXZ_01945 [Patescibacteria group bacterium]